MAFLRRALIFAAIWLVMTGGEASSWIAGAIAAMAASFLSLRLFPASDRTVKWGAAVLLLPGFLWRSIAGGADVAWRAVHPRLPLAPGWIRYRTSLPAGASRVSLGCVVSLLPGTLVAAGSDDHLLVHCLDRDQPIVAQLSREERRIRAALAIAAD